MSGAGTWLPEPMSPAALANAHGQLAVRRASQAGGAGRQVAGGTGMDAAQQAVDDAVEAVHVAARLDDGHRARALDAVAIDAADADVNPLRRC